MWKKIKKWFSDLVKKVIPIIVDEAKKKPKR